LRPAVLLVATVALAAAAGTAISFTQKPGSAVQPQNESQPNAVTIPSPNQPAVAFGFSVAADLTTHQLVLFGGVDDFGTTWLWDGAAWTRAHPPTNPPGRYGASAAFDPRIGGLVLFGGTLETGQNTNDTWAWDGRTWRELSDGGGPLVGGGGTEMAWDPSRSEMVLVSVPANGRGGGQTWIWNGAQWARDAAGALGVNYSHVVVGFDPVSNSLTAQGCCDAASSGAAGEATSTWRWDGSAWKTVATSAHPPAGSSLEVDPSIQRLVLCSCDLAGGLSPEMWVWSGQNWTSGQYPLTPIAPEAEVIDPADSQFLILGSAIAGLDALSQPVQVWTLRGTHWLRLGVGLASG
jgi:hypothetical protein